MQAIDKLAGLPNDQLNISFKADWSITNALKSLEKDDWLAWDADEFKHRSFHAIARSLGIRIATKAHKQISCYVILRTA